MTRRSDAEILQASVQAAYVGGDYYNPVDEFLSVARPLRSEQLRSARISAAMTTSPLDKPTFSIATLLVELKSLLRPDEVLFALYERPSWKFAVMIPTEERLLDFETQVNDRALTRRGFFAIQKKHANKGFARDFKPRDTSMSG